jgi:hypothetical protein
MDGYVVVRGGEKPVVCDIYVMVRIEQSAFPFFTNNPRILALQVDKRG